MNHLINRLRFEVACPDESQAFELRHNFAQTLQVQIMDVVDRVCSKHIGEDEWIQIDKLDIDLGKFNPHSFSTGFSEVFLYKFEKELIEKLSTLPVHKRKLSKQISYLELFCYFMEYGTLPWWQEEQSVDWHEISTSLFSQQTKAVQSFFLGSIQKPLVWKRAVFQLNTENREKLVLLFPVLVHYKAQFRAWLSEIRKISNQISGYEETRPNISLEFSDEWTKAIQNIKQLISLLDKVSPLEFNADQSVQEQHINHVLLENASLIFRQNESAGTIIQLFYKVVNRVFSGTRSYGAIFSIIKENNFPENNPEVTKENKDVQVLTTANLTGKWKNQETEVEAEQKLVVKHAGLVLLAPFLKPFFNKLALLEGPDWKNQEAVYKAIHLLKFLSTGLQQVPEFSLSLEKALCGFSVSEPVPIAVELEEIEIQECELLLSSVIEHWKVLKNTSFNGLRESFLKRDGLLTKVEKGWLLQVERKTLDVLLDSIPWGYSTLHFSWNEQVIYVEW